MAEQSIKVDATFHHSEISAMGKCKGNRNNAPVAVGGNWYVVGGIKFIRFCSLEFNEVLGTYRGVAEFMKVDAVSEAAVDAVSDDDEVDLNQVRSWGPERGIGFADFTVLMNAVE